MIKSLFADKPIVFPSYTQPAPVGGSPWAWLRFFMRPHGFALGFSLSANLLRQSFFRMLPFFLGLLVGLVEDGTLMREPEKVVLWIGGFSVVAVLMFFSLIIIVFSGRAMDSVSKEMGLFSFRHYLTLSEDWHENRASGEKLQRLLKAEESIFRMMQETLWGFIQLPAIAVAVLLSIIFLDAPIYFVVLFYGMVLSYIALSYITGNWMKGRLRQYYKTREDVVGGVYEFLISTSTVRFLNIRRHVLGKAEELETVNHYDRMKVFGTAFRRWFLLCVNSLFWILCIVGLATYHVYHGDLSIPAYTTIIFLTITIWFEIEYFAILYVQMVDYWEGFRRLVDVLNQKPSITDKADAVCLPCKPHLVTFENVGFEYMDEKSVIRNFDLVIKPGEKVAFVGPSGAGKSTIIKLLLRFYDVNTGRVLFDDFDVRDVSRESLQQNISVIPQDTVLFNHSILENIRFGRMDAGDDEVMEAARLAYAHDFIEALPEGYQTKVGERGVKLSGGQRQRVAIARAILKNSPILVLDEATSALDSESEQLIQRSFDTLMEGKTVIAIAHRLSTISHMDRVVVMDQGQIVEQGYHEELLHNQGLYSRLWEMQSGGFIKE